MQEVAEAIRKSKIATACPLVFRTVAADDIWLSPFYGRDSATITVHQYAKLDYHPLFSLCETIFRKYGGRPHWGKALRMAGFCVAPAQAAGDKLWSSMLLQAGLPWREPPQTPWCGALPPAVGVPGHADASRWLPQLETSIAFAWLSP